MTHLLKQAFAKASELPSSEQNVLARILLAELDSQRRWDEAFSESEQSLEFLATEALKEHRQGKTKLLKPERM